MIKSSFRSQIGFFVDVKIGFDFLHTWLCRQKVKYPKVQKKSSKWRYSWDRNKITKFKTHDLVKRVRFWMFSAIILLKICGRKQNLQNLFNPHKIFRLLILSTEATEMQVIDLKKEKKGHTEHFTKFN